MIPVRVVTEAHCFVFVQERSVFFRIPRMKSDSARQASFSCPDVTIFHVQSLGNVPLVHVHPVLRVLAIVIEVHEQDVPLRSRSVRINAATVNDIVYQLQALIPARISMHVPSLRSNLCEELSLVHKRLEVVLKHQNLL